MVKGRNLERGRLANINKVTSAVAEGWRPDFYIHRQSLTVEPRLLKIDSRGESDPCKP